MLLKLCNRYLRPRQVDIKIILIRFTNLSKIVKKNSCDFNLKKINKFLLHFAFF